MVPAPGDGLSRRAALRRLCLAGGTVGLAGCSTANVETETPVPSPETARGTPVSLPDRPNVLLIYADDLGWLDTGFQGSRYYETPHLDALAASGTTFRAAYANAPNCAPSRACLLTGQYTPRHGVYTVREPETVLPSRRALDPPPNNLSLPTDNTTLAEALSAAGYDTGFVGKWHLGEAGSEYGPVARGFDANVGGDIYGKLPSGYFPPYDIPNVDDSGDAYLTDRLTDVVVDYLRAHAADDSDPFFMYYAPYSVHTPLQAPRDDRRKYRDKPCWNGQCNETYGGMVTALDDSVGRITAALEDTGLAGDTVVVFTSDNGGVGDYEEVGLSPDWQNFTSQGPLRAGKGTLYEGGTRVPTVVAWPGVLPGGRRSQVPVAGFDFFPTVLDLADARDAVPDDHAVDGESLVPLLANGPAPDREALFWHFPAYLAGGGNQGGPFRTRPVSIVRAGRWKLRYHYETDRSELYDLRTDRGEETNLAAERPERRRALRDRLFSWLDDVDARRPTPK